MNRTSRQSVFQTTTSRLPRLEVPDGALLFPDYKGWTNRFEIQAASGKFYTISQHIEKRHWGCSCTGWRNHRKCKHLTELNLPNGERPYEVELQLPSGAIIAPSNPAALGNSSNAPNVARGDAGREVVGLDQV